MRAQNEVRYMDRSAADVAERILAAAFGGAVRLGPEEPLRAGVDAKPNVRRCRVESGPASCPGSVIVKRIIGWDPYDPADVRPTGGSYGLPTMAWRLLAEWVAARFLGDRAAGVSPAPRCWGGDLADGVVVLEDLGPGDTLRHLLFGADSRRAEEGLLSYARILGMLHALTAGREAEYRRLWSELGGGTDPGAPRAIDGASLRSDLAQFHQLADRLGVPASPAAAAESSELAAWLEEPGPFLSLIHSEHQPVNTHVQDGAVRLFDFEYSRFYPCVMDGMFLHLYPWVRHRLPDALRLRMEEIYRTELATGCPEAEDRPQFDRAYAAARAIWMVRTVVYHLSRGVEESDVPARDEAVHVEGDAPDDGGPTYRQRILLLLEGFRDEAEARGCLPALRDQTGEMARRLRARWGSERYAPPRYPAFAHPERRSEE